MRLMQRPVSLINANHIKQSIHHNLVFRAQPLHNHWRRLILLLCVTTLLAAVIHHSEIITSTYLNHDHQREDSGTSKGNKDNYNFLNQELLITNGLHSGGMRLHSTAAATADSDNNSIINKPKHEIRTGGKDGYADSGKNGRTTINSRKKSIGMKRSKPDATTANDGDASLESWRGVKCDGKRVFMYNLPPEFNTAILGECDRKMVGWLDFCRHVQHQGFGQQVTDPAWADWYETDPYMLELIFHHKMMAYPCLVPDPADADAFFLPYYSGLDALRYLYGNNISQSADQGLSLLRWLRQHGHKSKSKSKSKSSIHDRMADVAAPDFYWRRKGGHDHFMVMGRTAWDFTAPLNGDGSRGWGTSLASLPQMENVTALFLERRPWRWAEQAVPYPTAFHPRSASSLAAWQRRVLDAHRTFLSAFVGARRSSARPGDLASIRQAALQQCLLLLLSSANSSNSSCTLVDCSKIKCAHNPIVIAEQLLHADFCLQPPGDTSTRRSTFDGMLSGCIPVFFHTDSAYSQYTWHLPPPPQVSAEGVLHPKASYSIFIGVDDINRTHEILASIPRTRVIEMRSFIVHHLLPDILYADPTAPDLRDAFQISVESMLSRAAQAPSLSLVS